MVQVEVQEHTGDLLAPLEKSNYSTGRDLTLVDGDGNETVPTVSASSVIQISRPHADQQAIAGIFSAGRSKPGGRIGQLPESVERQIWG